MLASLSTTTGTLIRRISASRSGSSRQARCGENITVARAASTKPAAPMPTAATSCSALSSSTSSTIVSSTARTLRPGVARRRTVSTVPNESTTPPSTFVPPMSMPIVNGPGRPINARRGAGRVGSGMSGDYETRTPLRWRHAPAPTYRGRPARPHGDRPGRLTRARERRRPEGPAPAERARLQRRPRRRARRHVDADGGDPLPGRQPPGTDRPAERPHADQDVRRCAGALRQAARARGLGGSPHRDQPGAELRVAGARRRQRGGAGRDRRQPALPPAGDLLVGLEVRAGRRRSATTPTPAAACGCTTSRGSRRAGSASTRSRSTAPRSPRSTPTTCSAPTSVSRTAASGSAGGWPTGSGTSRRPAPRSSSPLVEVRARASLETSQPRAQRLTSRRSQARSSAQVEALA